MQGTRDLTWFNVQHGFLEALLKGLRKSFLTDHDYTNLRECKGLDDLKLNLQETDYGDVLEGVESNKVNAKLVQQRCHEKLAKEFEYIRAHANEPLASFMDYIRYEYQIQTVISLLKATTKGYEPASEEIQEVMDTCHPLGKFDESVMRSITAFDSSPDGLEELYATVLVEIPVGKYFSQFLAEETEKSSVGGVEEARTRLREMPLATLENSIYKLYLEDFHRFCLSMEGETAEQMDRILSMRADMISINITYNSLRTHYNNSAERESSRKALYPSFGALYPEGTFELAKVDSESGIGAILQKYGDYARVWESAPTRQIEQDYYTGDDEEDVEGQQQQEGGLGGGLASAAAGSSEERDIAQAFFQHTVKVLETAFDGQFHFAMFYAYVKLKEQEAKNLAWIATCLKMNKSEFDRIVPIFRK